jgi:tetratricopeptide (TPR) repeat protein
VTSRRAPAWRALGLTAAYVLAAGCAGRAPRVAPPAPEPTHAEAEGLRRSGESQRAAEAFARLRAARPSDVAAHLGYVRTLSEDGRRSQAREEYALRAAAPDALEVDRVLAERLASDQSSSALRGVYERAAAREPQCPWWTLGLAEVELAEADAWKQRREAARDEGDRDEETEADRQAHAALKRADRALDRTEALGSAQEDATLYRGYVRAVEGDLASTSAGRLAAYRAALDCFERVSVHAPERLEGWYGLADAQARLGEPGESLVAWIQAVRLAPHDAYARLELARALQSLERVDEAARQYREVAVLRPRSAEPWIRLGDTYAEDERWHAAVGAYREALERDPEAIEAWMRLGGVLEQTGDLEGARDAYQRYVEQDGERKTAAQRALDRLLVGKRKP